MMCMTNYEVILTLAKENNGIVTATMIQSLGIVPQYLKDLVQKGLLEHSARGIYILPEVWSDGFVNLQYRFKRGIYAKETALFLLDLNISIEDQVVSKFERLEKIRENDDYNGYRVHLSASFAPMCVPLKLDITTGDKITPKEIKYECKSMMDENTSISILAYNIETVIAEKLEAILSRGDQTTRLRDYYDVYILWKLQRINIAIECLSAALTATVKKRGTLNVIKNHIKQWMM